jgi:hypothetical protein
MVVALIASAIQARFTILPFPSTIFIKGSRVEWRRNYFCNFGNIPYVTGVTYVAWTLISTAIRGCSPCS